VSRLDLVTLGAKAATATSPLDALATETQLDRCVALLDRDDATLTDIRAVVHALGRSTTPVDPIQLTGICMRLAGILDRYDSEVREAPPAALNDVVRDSLVGCRNDLCGEKVAPWNDDYSGCCSVACETTWLRTVES
jgi:hypothetical protein